MLLLHTSDLHIGKRLHEESLIEDQKYILNEIIKIIKDRKVDVLMIAGDIYDRSDPSIEAINVFNDFLTNLYKENIETMIISGNHDSLDRLSFGSKLFDDLKIHIASIYNGHLVKYSIEDVDFYLMPFVRKFQIKDFISEDEYEKMSNQTNDIIKWVLDREMIDKNRKNILLTHQFVTSGKDRPELSDSESGNYVGTLDEVDAGLFADFDYVALGHIHRSQHIKKESIRYSGSPLIYSFNEVNKSSKAVNDKVLISDNTKHVVLYDTDSKVIEKVELNPLRQVKRISGLLEDVLKVNCLDSDLIDVVLLDEERIESARADLERKFKNLLHWDYLKRVSATRLVVETKMEPIENKGIEELFKDFYKYQTDDDLNDLEKEVLDNTISTVIKEK